MLNAVVVQGRWCRSGGRQRCGCPRSPRRRNVPGHSLPLFISIRVSGRRSFGGWRRSHPRLAVLVLAADKHQVRSLSRRPPCRLLPLRLSGSIHKPVKDDSGKRPASSVAHQRGGRHGRWWDRRLAGACRGASHQNQSNWRNGDLFSMALPTLHQALSPRRHRTVGSVKSMGRQTTRLVIVARSETRSRRPGSRLYTSSVSLVRP